MSNTTSTSTIGPYVSVYGPFGRFGALSTFAEIPMIMDGLRWPSVEHYFQAQKFDVADIREEIRGLADPDAAKALAWSKAYSHIAREDWDHVRLDIMHQALEQKFQQSPIARRALIASWPMPILDASTTDNFWGVGPEGRGENALGRLLQEVRKTFMPEGWTFDDGPLPSNDAFLDGSDVRWHCLNTGSLKASTTEVHATLSVPDLLRRSATPSSLHADAPTEPDDQDALLSRIFDEKYACYSWFEDARCAIADWPQRFLGTLASLTGQLNACPATLVVGAGAGNESSFVWRHCGSRVTLVDVGQRLIENCRKQAPEAWIVRARAQTLQVIKTGSVELYCGLRTFDAAYFNREQALREAARILVPRGRIVVTFSNGYLRSDGLIEAGQIVGDGSLDLAAPWRLMIETANVAADLGFTDFDFLDLDSEIGFSAVSPNQNPDR